MTDYGMLVDHATGEQLRPASRDEWRWSVRSTNDGGFRLDVDDERVYRVVGGPRCTADRVVDVNGAPIEVGGFIVEEPGLGTVAPDTLDGEARVTGVAFLAARGRGVVAAFAPGPFGGERLYFADEVRALPAYTVQVQRWDAVAGWRPVVTENVGTTTPVKRLAADVVRYAIERGTVSGEGWRVAVWTGADADTTAQPAHVRYAPSRRADRRSSAAR